MRFPNMNFHTHTTYCDGKETAELPLSGSKEVSVKVNGYRIDITVAPEQ